MQNSAGAAPAPGAETVPAAPVVTLQPERELQLPVQDIITHAADAIGGFVMRYDRDALAGRSLARDRLAAIGRSLALSHPEEARPQLRDFRQNS